MVRKAAGALILGILLVLLASCGSDSLLMSLGKESSDLEIDSVADGEIVAAGAPLSLQLTAREPQEQKDLEIEVSLTSPAGQSVWKSGRIASPAVNEDLALQLPDLPDGQYQLEIVVFSHGEQIRKRISTFFIARESVIIAGIKSFPPVITTGATVLLKAELTAPAAANPYLRWSWKGRVFARGLLNAGTGEALWVAPSEEGVYSIRLELFPSAPPPGADFPFASSVSLSADLYVTAGMRPARGDLGPEQSYWSLLHLQGNLKEAGAAAKKAGRAEAAPIGTPQLVQVEDGFGYRLDGQSGIAIPWLVLPGDGGILKPFTVSIGLAPESFEAEQAILSVTESEGAFSLSIALDPATQSPRALITSGQGPRLEIPWQGPSLSKGRRYLVSLSVIPQGKTLSAAWFLDGEQVSRVSAELTIAGLKPDGKAVIGGEKGFIGIVDEFGVFYRDDQGRPSPDPGLYRRAALAAHGDALVIADGFDGPFLPSGFGAEVLVELDAGTLVVRPGAKVDLPPVAVGADDVDYSISLSPGSATDARLALVWEGSSFPALESALTAEAGILAFTVKSGAAAVTIPSPGGEKSIKVAEPTGAGNSLVVRIAEPADAKSPLLIDSLLAVRRKY
jgi:hypothetical protein